MIVCIDPGHGGTDPGGCSNGLREKDLTLDISLRLNNLLKNYEVDIILTRDKDIDVGLLQRANMANSANVDFFISIHINAGGGSGFESYRHPAASDKTASIQAIIHRTIANLYESNNFIDRGEKTKNLAVLRETKMPAILVENLFIDSVKDANFLREENNRQAIAQSICNGIVQAFGLKQKTKYNPLDTVIDAFVKAGIITSQEYWKQNAVEGKQCDGGYVAVLLQRIYEKYMKA
ncbi:N-acetylmuramoyl-L-alanine amidase [Thermoanaerobacterium sp. R66]|uniref:N-acetylmuramoyl-L-alanine amidase family protein n=1 Tax=Thermoanaerobacterium sp. R66 TaxID=2742479 RepID=UPI002380B35E|nr:N-acetylmuramoyl-L-alanine amidase [Thermoanaerobacterium sp. R66]MDE4542250.1 N-acetylmuramoyl-L-alanine amidase [Thermoanaerobacterium sp. R66]